MPVVDHGLEEVDAVAVTEQALQAEDGLLDAGFTGEAAYVGFALIAFQVAQPAVETLGVKIE
ncbi:hypothetical protein D3C71_1967610 [compost metagenome]